MSGMPTEDRTKKEAARERSHLAGALVVILLLAFTVRIHGLGAQSYWYDEGLSVGVAQLSWGEIARGAGEYHPPLYVLLLAGWTRLVGTGEFGVRYLSLFCSVLLVALGAALGNLLFGRRVAALTALFLAVSPIDVWYAQEARMYALLGALALASNLALLRLMRGDRRRWLWVLYTLANIGALYSHYYAVMALAVQVFWVVLHLIQTRDWRLARSWIVAQAVIGLAYSPWLPTFWQQAHAQDTTYWPGTLNWLFIARATLLGFAGAGLVVSDETAAALAALSGSLAALGLLLGLWRARTRRAVLQLAIYAIVPFVILYLLVRTRPKYSPRYLLLALLPLQILTAAGAASLWPAVKRRWHEWLRAGVAAIVLSGLAIGSAYAATNPARDPSFGRDDMRGVADYLTHAVGDDEAVILLSGHFLPAFSHYYHRPNCYPIPSKVTPAPDVDDVVGLEVLDDLNRALEGRNGVWLVLWQDDVVDPNGVVRMALERVGTEVQVEQSFRGFRLRRYIIQPGASLKRDDFGRQQIDVSVGRGELKLASCDLPEGAVPAGGTAPIVLYWQTLQRTDQDYRVLLRVLDENGQEMGREGGRLAGYMYPTDRWQPGTLVVGRHRVTLPRALLPGEYVLEAVVFPYGASSGQTVLLGRLRVSRASQPPALDELEMQQPLDVSLGHLQLLGSSLSPTSAAPGQPVSLDLFWRVTQLPVPPWTIHLQLGEQPWVDEPLPGGVGQLEAGDVFFVRHRLIVPRDAAPGPYTVSLAANSGVVPTGGPVHLGVLAVEGGERRFAPPEHIGRPRRVDLDGKVLFLGYDLDTTTASPGDTLHLTLYWQAVQVMETSYTVFTHLLDEQSKIWGQVDSVPLQGARPTTGWLPGEVFVDTYDIPIRSDAPLGSYIVEVGLYDPVSGVRLPVWDEEGRRLPDDRILLDPVQLQSAGP